MTITDYNLESPFKFKVTSQNMLEVFFFLQSCLIITTVICVPRVWYSLDKLITRRSQMRSSSAASVGPPASCLASRVLAHPERWPACTTPRTFAPALMETSRSSESSVTTNTLFFLLNFTFYDVILISCYASLLKHCLE